MNETLNKLIKSYSTYVVLVITGVAAYWLQLPPADQASLLAQYPWLKGWAPLAALVTFVAARAAPQSSVTGDKPDADKKE